MKTNSFSLKARSDSFRCALKGIYCFFRQEPNALIHLAASAAVVAGIFYFRVRGNEVIALVLAMGFVWMAEVFNTAIEKIMDFVSPGYHPAAGLIKDLSAAAVLLAALTAIITGGVVFIPKIICI